MTKTLFVCYHHGCRGEGLTYKISQHSFFKTLEADIVNNRTIIKNDYCNKQLLNSWIPNWSSIKLPTDINIVVPSHFRYNKLKKHFPEAYFGSARETPWREGLPYANGLRTAVEHLQEMDGDLPHSDWRYGVY